MKQYLILIFCLVATAFVVVSCANIGSPDGGPYDEKPPVMLGAKPAQGATDVDKKKMSIQFNEFIKLVNANEKVIVSPPQMEAANIRADGKSVKITLYDSLQANTTYTIDFGDAIEDNNEGNPMGFFTYSFSTGATLDSMEVAGTIINAENLEPVKGMLVGLHRADALWNDSVFTKSPLVRISRTNGSGKFSIKGVGEGSYRVFGLMDGDGDYRYSQKSEMLAFDTTVVVPSCRTDMRQDTCWHDSIHYDSIRTVQYTHYYPDNLVLKAFTADGQDLHLLKTERQEPNWFRLYFTAPQKTLPRITGLNFDASRLILEASEHKDTLTYWITDTAFTHHNDSLDMVLTYMDTDTAGILVERTDTLPTLVPKKTWSRISGERQKQADAWQKQYDKRQKKSKTPLPPERNPFLEEVLDVKIRPTGSMDANHNITISSTVPIERIDSAKIHLYVSKDSDLIVEPFLLRPKKNDMKSYVLYAEWKPGKKYSLLIDSLAVTSIMGTRSGRLKSDINVRKMDEYGALFVNILPKDTCVVVQLLDQSDKVRVQHKTGSDGTAEFFFLKPDTYYMRCFVDSNGNGIWDTGDYLRGRQPEEVYYFPKPMVVRAKWDLEQDWDIRSIDILTQKPEEIRKQKADTEKTPTQRNAEREAEKQKRKNGN